MLELDARAEIEKKLLRLEQGPGLKPRQGVSG
jgi:hypothetical protein